MNDANLSFPSYRRQLTFDAIANGYNAKVGAQKARVAIRDIIVNMLTALGPMTSYGLKDLILDAVGLDSGDKYHRNQVDWAIVDLQRSKIIKVLPDADGSVPKVNKTYAMYQEGL